MFFLNSDNGVIYKCENVKHKCEDVTHKCEVATHKCEVVTHKKNDIPTFKYFFGYLLVQP